MEIKLLLPMVSQWHFSWSFLKEEVMGFFKDFHD